MKNKKRNKKNHLFCVEVTDNNAEEQLNVQKCRALRTQLTKKNFDLKNKPTTFNFDKKEPINIFIFFITNADVLAINIHNFDPCSIKWS